MYGEDGDDEIWASRFESNEMFGGAGDDMLLAGVIASGGLTQENFPNMPRRATLQASNATSTREDNVSTGNLDIHGGDGDDFIIGGDGSNDIYGGKGNDVIYGS